MIAGTADQSYGVHFSLPACLLPSSPAPEFCAFWKRANSGRVGQARRRSAAVSASVADAPPLPSAVEALNDINPDELSPREAQNYSIG